MSFGAAAISPRALPRTWRLNLLRVLNTEWKKTTRPSIRVNLDMLALTGTESTSRWT